MQILLWIIGIYGWVRHTSFFEGLIAFNTGATDTAVLISQTRATTLITAPGVLKWYIQIGPQTRDLCFREAHKWGFHLDCLPLHRHSQQIIEGIYKYFSAI